jgi:hypothetical protein
MQQINFRPILIDPDKKTVEYIETKHEKTDASTRDQFSRVIPWFTVLHGIGVKNHFALIQSDFTPSKDTSKARFSIKEKTITGKAIILEKYTNEHGLKEYRDPSVNIEQIKALVSFID